MGVKTGSRRGLVLVLDGGLCHYCHLRDATTVDHIVPRCVGGPTKTWNLAPACEQCNGDKAARRRVCRRGEDGQSPCFRCEAAERRFADLPAAPRKAKRSSRSKRLVVVADPEPVPEPVPERPLLHRCPRCDAWRRNPLRECC
jgi:hypothetical protein